MSDRDHPVQWLREGERKVSQKLEQRERVTS